MLAVDRPNTTDVASSSWSPASHHSRHRRYYQNGYADCYERKEEHHHLITTIKRTQSKRIDIDSEEQKLRCIQNKPRRVCSASATMDVQKSTAGTTVYQQIPRTKNFHIKVYRNGDSSRCVWCMSCSMETIFTSATTKFQNPIRFRRLFDTNGHEIFRSEDIIRGMEYYVSTGENFISPLRAIQSVRHSPLNESDRPIHIVQLEKSDPPRKSGSPKKPDRKDGGPPSPPSYLPTPSTSPSTRSSTCDCSCHMPSVKIVDPCISCCRVFVSALGVCFCGACVWCYKSKCGGLCNCSGTPPGPTPSPPSTSIQPQIENPDTGKNTEFSYWIFSGK
ncbi:unnamed protein product [Rotaria sp. Silwood1]|nr:unnamed protein product [Rotaria sp. Silwood1]